MKPVFTFLLIAAVLGIECVLGGTRLIFSLPFYAILAAAALLTLAVLRKPIAQPSAVCLGATGVIFTYVLWRAATSPVSYLAWPDFYMVIACLIVYLLTALYLTQTRLRTAVIVALLALAVVELMCGLRQFRYADNWMPFGFIRSDYGARASGTFISSITLAGYLEAVGIFALSLAIWSTWKTWARVALGYVGLCCYAGIAITGSRGGYISSVASLAVLAGMTLWLRGRVNPGKFLRNAAITTALLGVGLAVSIFLMQKSVLLHERLEMIGRPDVRWFNWLAALDQFRLAPWTGTGAGTHLFFGRLFRRVQLQVDPEHAHSDYLEMLAEYGLIGLCGLLIFVFIHVQNGLGAIDKIIKKAPRDLLMPFRDNRLAFQVGALTAISAYAVHSITDFNLHIPGHALIFAFIFGITANPVAEALRNEKPWGGILLARLALPGLGLWMLCSGLTKLPSEYFSEKARVAVRDRRVEDALDFAHRGLEREQRNPFFYAYIGQARRIAAARTPLRTLREPHLRAAVAAFRNATRIFPQEEAFWVRLGQALDSLGEYRDAETAYINALALDPNLVALHSYYASHLRESGQLEEADAQMRHAAKIATGAISGVGRPAVSDDEVSQKK